jgi:protein tyrosine/serine phosphatase
MKKIYILSISVLVILIGISAVACWSLRDWYREQRFNFKTVEENQIYRSGLPSKENLGYLKEKYKIKTIFSFSGDITQEYKDIEDFARENSINLIKLPMVTEKDPVREYVATYLAEVNQSNNWPVLVHCGAGVDRTSWMIALFRMVHQGWSWDRAYEEAKKCGLHYKDKEKGEITSRIPALAASFMTTNGPVTPQKQSP